LALGKVRFTVTVEEKDGDEHAVAIFPAAIARSSDRRQETELRGAISTPIGYK